MSAGERGPGVGPTGSLDAGSARGNGAGSAGSASPDVLGPSADPSRAPLRTSAQGGDARVPAPRLKSGWVRVLVLLLCLAAALAFSPLIGPEPLPWRDVLSILLHRTFGPLLGGPTCPVSVSASQCTIWTEIVWDARVPAVLLAAFVGASLGASGAGLQGVFRNSLADPYLLGLSSGAALGAALAIALSQVPAYGISPTARPLLLPVAAFVGGLVPGSLVLVASVRWRAPSETLLLTGVALNALFSAVLASVLLYFPNIDVPATFWLLGGLSYATWVVDALVLAVLLVAGLGLTLHGRALNLLQLGEEVAQSLGTDSLRTTRRVVLLATLTTAVAVAFVGIIGFVGLVAPHIVRRLVGVDYRKVLPLSMAAGAAFLISAWDVSQVIIPSVVIPVGIPTAFVGSVFFLYLLHRRRGRSGSGRGR